MASSRIEPYACPEPATVGVPFYLGAQLFYTDNNGTVFRLDNEPIYYEVYDGANGPLITQGTLIAAIWDDSCYSRPPNLTIDHAVTLEIRFYYAGSGIIPPVPIQFGNVRVQGGSPGCVEGTHQGAHVCDDGSTIYDQVCVGGVWVPTGDACPVIEVCRDAHPQQECIGDLVWDCVSNQWVNTGVACGGGQPQPFPVIPAILIGAAIVGTVAFLLLHK